MIKILTKNEAKKYITCVSELFRLKREVSDIYIDSNAKNEFNKLLKRIEAENLYETEPIKKEIVRRRFLLGESFMKISEALNYSSTYIYTLYNQIIKDFTMVIFQIVIL